MKNSSAMPVTRSSRVTTQGLGEVKSYPMAARALSISGSQAARLADPALRQALLEYARRRLPPAEVEDLVQNTLADALVSASAPPDPGDVLRWLRGIARHKIADSYRGRGRARLSEAEPDAPFHDPAPATGELRQWIETELPQNAGARTTLHWLLREGDGESLDEIARDAALPAPRVRQRVSRLRRHFHSRWLALGAAGLALLLSAAWLLHSLKNPESAPVIAKEVVKSASPIVEPAPAVAPVERPPSKQLAPKKQVPRKPDSKKPKPSYEQTSKSNAPPMNKY